MQCQQKRVFIIGASCAVGAACAEVFAREGANLLICGDDMNQLNSTATSFRTQFLSEVTTVRLNVQDEVLIAHTMQDLSGLWSCPDIVINTTEISRSAPFNSPRLLQQWLAVRRQGMLEVNQRLIGKMRSKNSGIIINVGFLDLSACSQDIAKFIWVDSQKHNLTNALVDLVKGAAVRVSEVSPKNIQGNFFSSSDHTVEDIANTVLFCASRPKSVNVSLVQLATSQVSKITEEERT